MGVRELQIPQAKLVDYLLDIDHLDGGPKARFFLARGFDRIRPDELANALAIQAMWGWPGDELPVPGAVKHRISLPLDCPDGTSPVVLSVWQVDEGDDVARFITARPTREAER